MARDQRVAPREMRLVEGHSGIEQGDTSTSNDIHALYCKVNYAPTCAYLPLFLYPCEALVHFY